LFAATNQFEKHVPSQLVISEVSGVKNTRLLQRNISSKIITVSESITCYLYLSSTRISSPSIFIWKFSVCS